MKRRLEIIAVEYERTTQGVPLAPPAPLASCPLCQRATHWLTPAQVAQTFQVHTATVHRWLAAGKVHGLHTPGRRRRVCARALVTPPAPRPRPNQNHKEELCIASTLAPLSTPRPAR